MCCGQWRWLGGGERGLRVSISSVLPVRWGAPGGGFTPLLTYTLPSGMRKLLAYARKHDEINVRVAFIICTLLHAYC